VVATTMSNMGVEIALKKSGIRMLRANVGDKYVLEEMLKNGRDAGRGTIGAHYFSRWRRDYWRRSADGCE
jgi:phosphoglucosamine mutase